MKIKTPKIIQKLELKEYSEAFGDLFLEVWVNPPRAFLQDLKSSLDRIDEIKAPDKPLTKEEKEELEKRVSEILDGQLKHYAVLLSQGEESTRFTPMELRTMINEIGDTDPAFWIWVKGHISKMMFEHRVGARLN